MSEPAPMRLPEQGALEAAYWHDRLRAEAGSKATQDRFECWLAADPANALHFQEIEQAYEAIRTAARTPELLAVRHETLARIALRRRQPSRGAVAAGLAAVVVAGAVLIGLRHGPAHGPAPREDPVEAGRTYQTGPGQRTTVVLPDGSMAELDTRSRLRVDYTTKVRGLRLEAGQALFDVAKGKPRPFVVSAGGETIVAHGTQFDVRVAPHRTQVVLVEGRVAVTSSAAGRSMEMTPRDVLTVDDGKIRLRKTEDTQRFTSWREGVVVFDNTSLEDAVAEINRYTNQRIELSDRAAGALRLSGAFRADQAAGFVEALQLYFPLKVVERSPERIVLASAARR